jgi:hypothetical protein
MERADVHDNPFDPRSRFAGSGCASGRHVNPVEHDRDTAPSLQCASVDSPENSDEKRYEGVVASGVMRAMFPKAPVLCVRSFEGVRHRLAQHLLAEGA